MVTVTVGQQGLGGHQGPTGGQAEYCVGGITLGQPITTPSYSTLRVDSLVEEHGWQAGRSVFQSQLFVSFTVSLRLVFSHD